MCQLSPAQEEDTAIVSDTTDDLWFLTEGESEQVSVEMKEAALEEGSRGDGEAPLEDEDGGGKEEKADREVRVSTKMVTLRCLPRRVGSINFCDSSFLIYSICCSEIILNMFLSLIQMREEPDEESQCLSDDSDTEISTQVCFTRVSFRFIQILFVLRRMFVLFSLRMRGSAPSAGSSTRRTRNTAFAAGLCARTGTRTSRGSPIPSLSLISQHAAP